MQRQLPPFRPDRHYYERPNQKWQCGWLAQGYICHIGPSPDGYCITRAECTPQQQGDSWLCTRPDNLGGNCQTGPLPDGRCRHQLLPCQPRRSLHARRALLNRWVLLFTLGILLFAYSGSWQDEFLSPGALSTRHAAAVSDCTGCHVNLLNHDSVLNKLGIVDRSHSMSERCVDCHSFAAHSYAVHNLPVTQLAAMTSATQSRLNKDLSAQSVPWQLQLTNSLQALDLKPAPSALTCVTCHHEHRGKNPPAANLSNLQCQSCHTLQFSNFAVDHPEFSGYPYQRGTRIIYDHARHASQHFGETEKPFRCADCHELAVTGQQMRVKPFDEACLNCHGRGDIDTPGKVFHHGAQIVEKRASVAFITLPRLDVRTLTKQQIAFGVWPDTRKSARNGLTELGLTPFMELLLATDEDNAEALRYLQTAEVELRSLARAENTELEAVKKVLQAVKALLVELAQDEQAFARRIARITGQLPAERDLALLLGQMPHSLRQLPLTDWFDAELISEVSEYHRDRAKRAAESKSESDTETEISSAIGAEWISSGEWRVDDFSLQYRPGGHSDDFLQTWLDLSWRLSQSDSPLQPFAQDLFAELADSSAGPGESKGPGRCMKCHSVEADTINWQSFRARPEQPRFTRFLHQPHLQLSAGQDTCTACHWLQWEEPADDAKSKMLAGFSDNNPATFTSSFTDMSKSTCNVCHTPEVAGSRCLSCHSYHVVGQLPVIAAPE